MAGQKRKWDADSDFIATISDSDDVPDLDDSDTGEVPTRPLKETKKAKALKKRQKVDKDDSLDADPSWTSGGHDDGAFDPDFHFEDDNVGTLQAFDGWDTAVVEPAGLSRTQKVVDLDEIIRRRQAKARDGVLSGDSNDIDLQAIGHGQATSQSFEEADIDGDGRDTVVRDALVAEPSPDRDPDDASGSENHDEAVADPMPEVNGLSDDEDESKALDPDEIAKRNAFFAPEDKSHDSNAVSEAENSFQSMSLSRPILRGLTAIGFTSPTPIQRKAVPVALLGKDIVGGAVTGSGKTAAFLLPILERLLYRPKKVATTRVSILLPTRELAVQCHAVAKKLAQHTDISLALIVGGLSVKEQEQTLKKRPDIVIATPGRFIDHMRNTASFAVESLEILVLDEADRMLEEGFADELNEVLKTIPRSRQTMLFSATMTQDVDKLIRVGMNRPVRLMVDARQQTVSGLVQEFVKLRSFPSDDEDTLEARRLATLVHLCKAVYATQTIVFIPTKSLAHRIKILFALQGIKAAELHGSMSQEQRLNAISSFRDGKCTHLLATDLASRGLDIARVDTVVNFTVPTTKETYLHRVGRTARAGRSGVSCTIFMSDRVASTSGKTGTPKSSERALLRPILRLAKAQKAPMRTRTLPLQLVDRLSENVQELKTEMEDIMKEEREERLLAQTERDMTKSENMIEHEEEIMSRPRRTWFQSEQDKKTAKGFGKDERLGIANGAQTPSRSGKDKKKLSGREKKRLDSKDERKGKQGWKKGKEERLGKGVLAANKKSKTKAKQKQKSKPQKKAKS